MSQKVTVADQLNGRIQVFQYLRISLTGHTPAL
jgi:hypothetical protein